MSTATARTLFGYDRIARALHKGNVGIRTGSTSRPGGKVHLYDSATKRTACGRARNSLVVSLLGDLTEDNWQVRVPMCGQCRAKVGA